jgi:hypothetical protein
MDGNQRKWTVETKTGRFDVLALRGVLEFCRRNPSFTLRVVYTPGDAETAQRHNVAFPAKLAIPESVCRAFSTLMPGFPLPPPPP